MHVASWRAGYRDLLPAELLARLSVDVREAQWREWVPASLTFVAEADGAVAGFVSALPAGRDPTVGPRTGEVAALYVDPRHWRRGLGRALLAAARDALRASGCDEAVLWVLAGNAPARAFYAAAGFTPDGTSGTHEASGREEVRLRSPLG